MGKVRQFILILLAAVLLEGCGIQGILSESKTEGLDAEQISEGKGIDKESLEEDGYENIADIAYAKIENKTLRLVYLGSDPESALYLAGILMTELNENYELIITWEDTDYEISEEKADGDEENFWKLFPKDWHETIDEAISGSGIQYLVSKGTADKIDEAVEGFIKNYSNNSENGENNQENSQVESNIEVIDNFEWEYDENNSFILGLTKDKNSGVFNVSAIGRYEDGNVGLAQNDYIVIFAMSYSSGIDSNIMCGVGEEPYLMTMDNGKILMNTFPSDIVEDVPETYLDSVKQMINSLDDFYVKNGLKEKTYNELVYEDENVKITFIGISGDGTDYRINFIVENLSNETIKIMDEEFSINGFMVDMICASEISPGKKAEMEMMPYSNDAEKYPKSEIYNIETKFHIFSDGGNIRYDTENVIVFDIGE